MQVLQNVARRYGLVCLLHEKPFAGVNGSGKHNNWSMGTDTGHNLLEPGRHAAENLQFLFFCAAVIAGGEQAPGAAARLDRRRPARTTASGPTRRRRRSSRSSSAPSWRRSFDAIESGPGRRRRRRRASSGLGTPVLPPLPMHGGDRNRTRPFAFTGNKFEFRALGSSQSLALPNTVLNTIVAEAIDDARPTSSRPRWRRGASLEEAVPAIVKDVLRGEQADRLRRRQLLRGVAPGGRGARAVRTCAPRRTPCPGCVEDQTVAVFCELRRAVRARARVALRGVLEQYVIKVNIEAETAATIAAHDAPARGGPPPRRCCRRPASSRAREETDGARRRASSGDHDARGGQRRRTTRRRACSTQAEVHAGHGAPGDGRRCATSPTGSSASWPTTSGRCRSTRRSSSSSRRRRVGRAFQGAG